MRSELFVDVMKEFVGALSERDPEPVVDGPRWFRLGDTSLVDLRLVTAVSHHGTRVTVELGDRDRRYSGDYPTSAATKQAFAELCAALGAKKGS